MTALALASPFGSVLDTKYVDVVSTHHYIVALGAAAALVKVDREHPLFSKGEMYGSWSLVVLVPLTFHVLSVTVAGLASSASASGVWQGLTPLFLVLRFHVSSEGGSLAAVTYSETDL